jgi:hypothetical protein
MDTRRQSRNAAAAACPGLPQGSGRPPPHDISSANKSDISASSSSKENSTLAMPAMGSTTVRGAVASSQSGHAAIPGFAAAHPPGVPAADSMWPRKYSTV